MDKKIEHKIKNVFTSSVSNENKDTGCTLIYFPEGGIGCVDVRGGSAATREDHSISSMNVSGWVDAIVFAGGSTYGLESASGVMQKIFEKRKFSTLFNDIPSVPAACVYDFRNRSTACYPDIEMGRKAFDFLQADYVEVGEVGAGTNVYVGKILKDCVPEKSGLGAHYMEFNGCSILAITTVNAFGNVIDFSGQIIKGSLDQQGQRKSISHAQSNTNPQSGNTTISCLVTNAKMTRTELNRLAIMVHTSMARVIEPFHTPFDGDVLYAVVPNGEQKEIADFIGFSSACSLSMQKAVLSVV